MSPIRDDEEYMAVWEALDQFIDNQADEPTEKERVKLAAAERVRDRLQTAYIEAMERLIS